MKNLIFAAVAALVICIPSLGQANRSSDDRASEIFAAITRWADAVRDRNTKELDQIFEDYVIITRSDSSTRGKKEELALFSSPSAARASSIRNEDVKVRVFGDAAIATGLNITVYQAEGNSTAASFRYTATFVRQDGRWQIVALHTSRRQLK